jgi:peptidoglycan/xylan/chitin deacetylase (PgdA/CDA1 family)
MPKNQRLGTTLMVFRPLIKKALQVIFLFSGYVQVRNLMLQIRGRSLITVLAYHRVDVPDGDVNNVSPENFARQMAFLRSRYRVVSVTELLEILARGRNVGRAVVITFDDGYRDNYLNAAPLLRTYHLPACFFLSSGIVGTKRHFEHDLELAGRPLPVLSWDEARELADMGFDIGSHTVNHARLSDCGPDSLCYELSESKSELERRLGKPVTLFSFPFGQESDFSPVAAAAVKTAGYVCTFSCYGGLNCPTSDPYELRRQWVADTDSLLAFRAWVEGWRMGSKY